MIFLVGLAIIFFLNLFEATTLNSSYEVFHDCGLAASFNNYRIFVNNLSSKLKCISECNKNKDCTVAIYSKESKKCELFSINSQLSQSSFQARMSSQVVLKKMHSINMSSVILSNAEVTKLYELGGFNWKHEFKLLYRATRDGFSTDAFHSKSNGIPNTLSIIESSSGYVFGGFTTQTWSPIVGYWKLDPFAYIFSLRRNVSGFDVFTNASRFNVTNP